MDFLLQESERGISRDKDTKALNRVDAFFSKYFPNNPEFAKQAFKLCFAFSGMQGAYLSWGYLQELIMTTQYEPTESVPDGKFPSAVFCVFSNRFLCVIIGLIAVRMQHGAFFANNKAPMIAYTPCSISNTISSWSQYASLRYVSFPVLNVFKSSKIIPVMIMGRVLKGTVYPSSQYVEALLITAGVAIFSVLNVSDEEDAGTEWIGLFILILFITSDSFTSQWQSRIYTNYGRENVDSYQMMLGVNMSSIIITTVIMVVSGDVPVVFEFLKTNSEALHYNVLLAVASACGQLCIFYTIKEFGPIVFTIIMTTRQMFSICISAMVFGHQISPLAAIGAILVFGVLFYQIYNKYKAKQKEGSSRRTSRDDSMSPSTTVDEELTKFVVHSDTENKPIPRLPVES